jgi:YtcA family
MDFRMMRRAVSAGVALPLLGGCSGAPSQNILGSYFPSWMICALAGILLAAVAHRVLARTGIDKAIPAPLLIYLAFAALFAFAAWLVWLG